MATIHAGGGTARRIQAGEWQALVLCFAYFFCVLAAYYILRPVREQLSAAVGSAALPWIYAQTFAVMLALAPLFGALVVRFPRRVLVPVVNLFFAASLLAFVPLFLRQDAIGAHVLGPVFFVWVSVFNLFVVSMFWIFMSDIWDEAQARRLFPLIAVAGTAGALAGPTLTLLLIDVVGIAYLLVVSAALLCIAVICVVLLGRWARVHSTRRHDAGHEAAVGGGILDGLRQVFTHRYIALMAVFLLLADGIGTVNYALLTDYYGTLADKIARTRMAANVELCTNLVMLLLQVSVARWLLARKGPGVSLMVWAGVVIAAMLLVMLVPDPNAPLIGALPAVAIALITTRGFAYGMAEPARHALFARLARNARYKGQSVVDTAVWRFGDVSIALGMNLLRSIGVGTAGFAGLAATSAAVAGLLGWSLSRWDTVSPRSAVPVVSS